MHNRRPSWLFVCFGATLLAQQPAWLKPIPSWTEADARQVLSRSPWTKSTIAGVSQVAGEDQRRESGRMGQPHGLGYDGLDELKPRAPLPTGLMQTDQPAVQQPPRQAIELLIRWESALPVRAARLKAREPDLPSINEDGFTIAVYGVPGSCAEDSRTIQSFLARSAVLQSGTTKDVKPRSVGVFALEGGCALVYHFPAFADIGDRDRIVEFSAVIGRIHVAQDFNLDEMKYQGKLAL